MPGGTGRNELLLVAGCCSVFLSVQYLYVSGVQLLNVSINLGQRSDPSTCHDFTVPSIKG